MRIGLIGDVHHEDLALAWALGVFQERAVDLVVCVGDICDGTGDLDTCCELLASHGVLSVRGNHDRWFLAHEMREVPDAAARDAISEANRAWLSELPVTQSIDTPSGRALLCHGVGDNDLIGVRPGDEGDALSSNLPLQALFGEGGPQILIAGHTHEPMQRTIGGLTIVNAGTLHRRYRPCIGIFDAARLKTEFLPVPAHAVR